MKAPTYTWVCYRCAAASGAGTSTCTSCGSPARVSGKDLALLTPAADPTQLLPPSVIRAMQSAPSIAALALVLSVCLALGVALTVLLCLGGCGVGDDVVLTALLSMLTAVCWYINGKAAIRASSAEARRAAVASVLLLPAIVLTAYSTYVICVVVIGSWLPSTAPGH